MSGNDYPGRHSREGAPAPKGRRAVQRRIHFTLDEWAEIMRHTDALALEKGLQVTPRQGVMYLIRKHGAA
jgi:hypothetical protein